MYYLRKEAYEIIIPELKKEDGSVIPERRYHVPDRAIYKSNKCPRFYRKSFFGVNYKIKGMKLYTCKTLKTILTLRQDTFNYCGEWFDVYGENGKVEI